jgi:serine/threonine protein kinase
MSSLDIKPANIVLDEKLDFKLIDFGLTYNFSRHTYGSQFNIVGTSDFMSPEMIRRNVSNLTKCGIYSLGITFIECAFAFHYNDDYTNYFATKESISLLTYLLRYIPAEDELTSPPKIPETLKLSPVMKSDDNIWIHDIEYKLNDIIITVGDDNSKIDLTYDLKALYLNILDIHNKYSLFREMIKINPDERCSIDYIIAKCNEMNPI